jgi:hypothetical protein
MPFVIPTDLAGDLGETLMTKRDHTAVRDFLALAAGCAHWLPPWPPRLVRLAVTFGAEVLAGLFRRAQRRLSREGRWRLMCGPYAGPRSFDAPVSY